MSSAVGPFAVDEGLVRPNGDTAVVRIFNTNTRKIIRARPFRWRTGTPPPMAMAIPGVAGTGAPVRLDFLAPGGATTRRGCAPEMQSIGWMCRDWERSRSRWSITTNACVFVRARDLGLTGRELPEAGPRSALLERMQVIRRLASIAMGIARNDEEARATAGVPIIGFVAPPMDAPTLSGEPVGAAQVDSDGAVPLERAAASGAASDCLAVHRGSGQDYRDCGGGGAGARARAHRCG